MTIHLYVYCDSLLLPASNYFTLNREFDKIRQISKTPD